MTKYISSNLFSNSSNEDDLEITVSSYLKSYWLVDCGRRFRETCCLYSHCRTLQSCTKKM
jgi:hypothetical protein